MKGKNEKRERCGGTMEEIVSRKDEIELKSHVVSQLTRYFPQNL